MQLFDGGDYYNMMHIITGPPCAGKTTYIRENAELGDLIIDFDEIASAFGAADHEADGIIRDIALRARAEAIKTATDNIETTSWIIDTNLTGNYPDDADVVLLDPGKDVCLDRAKQDNRPQTTIDGIDNWYSNQKGRTMEHKYKEFALRKSGDDAGNDTGSISGYFSTYDRIPDSYGDVIAKGAFTETIEKRKASGHPFPLCWNHDLNQIIGKVDSIEDTDKGPLMTASFFDTPLAQEKREIVKSGVVYQFSFAYDVLEAGPTELENGTKANELRKLDLFEVSIVPIPANQNAVMTDVKSGRRNRKSDEDIIKQIISLANQLLDDEVDDTDDPDDGKDNSKANGAPEEPKGSNPKKEKLLEYIKSLKEE